MGYDALNEKAKRSGIPLGALKAVYDRGIGAHSSNKASVRTLSGEKTGTNTLVGKMPKEQWAMARVNAFISKRNTVYYGADNDIRKKYGLQ